MKALICVVLTLVVMVSAGCRRQAPPPVVAAPAAAPVGSQSAPPAPGAVVNAEAVAEIAAYPGAMQLKREQAVNKDGYARVDEVTLHSADALVAVKAFYTNAIAAAGWQVMASEEKPDEVKWKLAKGSATAEVALDARSAGGVDIKIERKDR